MAEEKNASSNEGIEVPGEVTYTKTQEEALSQGWVPKEEFEGDEDKFVDAAEFVRRGELFRKIESQSKELKDVKKALNELAKHNAKVREVEYTRALESLKHQKKTALSEGDADRVVDIEDRIDLVKDQQKQLANQVIQDIREEVLNPELTSWINKNGWYETDKKMRAYADTIGVQLHQEGMSPSSEGS
jgi:hypothetical protein